MLWFDNSKDSLADKIQRAVAYYSKKYGRTPELCLVHPKMLANEKLDGLDKITVRPWRYVLTGHFWIGIEDEKELQKAEATA
jgi:hypothetical protein